MKNILIIHQSAELYGSDKTLLIFLKNIDRNKFFPIVVIPIDGPLKYELEQIEIKVVVTPVLKLYRDIFTFKNGFKFLKEIFNSVSVLNQLHKEYKFDIVYSNTLAVLLGAIFSKKKRIKHIWHVHEIIEHPKTIAWLFPKILYYCSNQIICNSDATKKNIIERDNRNEKKIVVIHNGIQENKCNLKNTKKSDYGFSENDVVLTLVGRISRLKGHNWLLQTFNGYFKNSKNIKLLFVGSPVPNQEHYLNNIVEYIRKNNLTECVKITPFTQELDGIWNITDIALMPSTEKESFGLVAAEAMMYKKPVIASNDGGLKEIIVNNETGFLVETLNKEELKEAIEILINDSDKRIIFGENGYNRIISKFNTRNYVLKLEEILENN